MDHADASVPTATGQPGSVVEALATRLQAVSYAGAPTQVQDKVRDCLLHALVVGAGAGETEFPVVVRRLLDELLRAQHAQSTGSTVLLGIGQVPAANAAWANAVLCHSRVQEDTHDTVHPGVTVIPAALALAQREGASGAELLDAVLRGYETATALSAVFNARVTPPLRATGAFGPVAAAAAGASILGLDGEATQRALAMAAAMAGGTTESFAAGTQEWHYQAGQAAQTGVVAADLAAADVPASSRAFEGPGGYLAAYAGGVRADDVDAVVRRLEAGWGITEVTFKPYPVCAFNQAPAAAAVELARVLDGRDVLSAEVRMSPAEARYPGVDNPGPLRNAEQAIMSAQCAVAAAILDQNVTFRRLRSADAPLMQALVTRIRVVADDGLPNKRAVVSARLASGEELSVPSPDMDEELRWGSEEVLANALRLLPETTLSEEALHRLRAAITDLPGADDLKELGASLP